MKKLRLLIPALLLLLSSHAAVTGGDDKATLTKNHAISTYIAAMTHGNLDGLNDVIDPSATFTQMQGRKMGSYTRKQMLEFLSGIKNIECDCTTSTSVFETNESVTIIKVDMQFSKFTRSNYVTIANTGSGWKILNVHSVFN